MSTSTRLNCLGLISDLKRKFNFQFEELDSIEDSELREKLLLAYIEILCRVKDCLDTLYFPDDSSSSL